ncbi:hypothetical protein JCM11641_006269 [Rhodosporidiobolus odoratus]
MALHLHPLDFPLLPLTSLTPTQLALACLHSSYDYADTQHVYRLFFRLRERTRNRLAKIGRQIPASKEDQLALLPLNYDLEQSRLEELSDEQLLCVQFHPEAEELDVLRAERVVRKRREKGLAAAAAAATQNGERASSKAATGTPSTGEGRKGATRVAGDIKPSIAARSQGSLPTPAQSATAAQSPAPAPSSANSNTSARSSPRLPLPPSAASRSLKRPRTPSPPFQLPPLPSRCDPLPPRIAERVHALHLTNLFVREINSRSALLSLFPSFCSPDASMLFQPQPADSLSRTAYVGFLDFEKRTEAMQEVLKVRVANRWDVKAEFAETSGKAIAWEWGDLYEDEVKERLWREECGREHQEKRCAREAEIEVERAEKARFQPAASVDDQAGTPPPSSSSSAPVAAPHPPPQHERPRSPSPAISLIAPSFSPPPAATPHPSSAASLDERLGDSRPPSAAPTDKQPQEYPDIVVLDEDEKMRDGEEENAEVLGALRTPSSAPVPSFSLYVGGGPSSVSQSVEAGTPPPPAQEQIRQAPKDGEMHMIGAAAAEGANPALSGVAVPESKRARKKRRRTESRGRSEDSGRGANGFGLQAGSSLLHRLGGGGSGAGSHPSPPPSSRIGGAINGPTYSRTNSTSSSLSLSSQPLPPSAAGLTQQQQPQQRKTSATLQPSFTSSSSSATSSANHIPLPSLTTTTGLAVGVRVKNGANTGKAQKGPPPAFLPGSPYSLVSQQQQQQFPTPPPAAPPPPSVVVGGGHTPQWGNRGGRGGAVRGGGGGGRGGQQQRPGASAGDLGRGGGGGVPVGAGDHPQSRGAQGRNHPHPHPHPYPQQGQRQVQGQGHGRGQGESRRLEARLSGDSSTTTTRGRGRGRGKGKGGRGGGNVGADAAAGGGGGGGLLNRLT